MNNSNLSAFQNDSIPFVSTTSDLVLLFDVLFMAVFGILGVSFGITGCFVVKRNSMLKGIIEHYALIDLSNYIIINTCHIIWGVPSAIWSVSGLMPKRSQGESTNRCPGNDNIISGFAFTAVSIGFPPKLFLGINRFCALSFDGRFYKVFEMTKSLQYAVMFGYPLANAIAFAFPGCHCIFVTNMANYFDVEDDECGAMIFYLTQVLACYILVPLQTFLDASVFFLMRRRLRSLQKVRSNTSEEKAFQIRKEMKLAIQMVTNLTSGLILTTTVLATSMAGDSLTSTFLSFILFTAIWLISTLIPWCHSLCSAISREERIKKATGHNGHHIQRREATFTSDIEMRRIEDLQGNQIKECILCL